MGGSTYTHSSNTLANNNAARNYWNAKWYEVTIAQRPANIQIDYIYINGPGNVTSSCSWSGTTFRWEGNGGTFYGGEPGTGPAVRAIKPDGTQYTQASGPTIPWTGGMGGRIDWTYTAPGKPTLHSSSRSSNGTSLTFQVTSGTGRVTANYTSLDQGVGQTNPKTYAVGAHQTVTLYGLSANEDRNSGWANLGTSYGIPNEPTFVNKGAIADTTVSARINVSWDAPSYVGAGITRYDVYRSGTAPAVYSGTATSFTDSNLTPGTTYSYTVYAINSTGTGVGGVTYARAPGAPSAPGTPSISKVGRNVTISSTTASIDGFGNAVTAYRVRYRTTSDPLAVPVVWSDWTTAVPMAVDGPNIVKTFELMTPALTYQFQTYAVNGIIKLANGTGNIDPDNYNFATSTTVFVSAGGRRKVPGGAFEPTQTAKRYDSTKPEGQKWIDLNTAKRYSSAANGGLGGWLDLS